MISGGTQHFTDFPVYSSYLIPLGLILSLVAYLLKNNYHITNKLWVVITSAFLLISIPLHFGLNSYANALVGKEKEVCKTSFLEIRVLASGGHGESNCTDQSNKHSASPANSMEGGMKMGDSMMMGMTHMTDSVKDDQSFLEGMIPHHQEAVDSSNQVFKTTTDPELKTFAQNVIVAQTKEIIEMKTWYKTWFNKDYTPNSNYMAMMGGVNGKTGKDLDKEYVKGMLGHHGEAIEMAKKIQGISKRPEILKLSNDIITSQTTEVKTLNDWLMEKYDDHSMMGGH